MKSFADSLLLCLVGALCAAAIAVVVLEPLADERTPVEREFQHVVGGLGFGPQVGLSNCFWQFDPRLAGDDDAGLDCIAGLGELSPWHSIALFPSPQPFTVGD